MNVINYHAVPEQKVEDGGKNATIRWILTENEGADHFYMRIIEIAPRGYTPHHAHSWEHEFYILEGEGKLVGDDVSIPLGVGDAGIVPAGEKHHFESTPGTSLKFICLIPSRKCL
ncbi:MAG: cupin domain-containing protein [Candidatus Latescibacter sp.]|nr:cupin domain-containing protein [Candidatus Latescibacter sp.]